MRGLWGLFEGCFIGLGQSPNNQSAKLFTGQSFLVSDNRMTNIPTTGVTAIHTMVKYSAPCLLKKENGNAIVKQISA
jgi:hypothetical protein